MKPTQITNPKDGRDVFILGAGFSKAVREIMQTLDELGQEIRQESRGQDGPGYDMPKWGNTLELWMTDMLHAQPWLSPDLVHSCQAIGLWTRKTIARIIQGRTRQATATEAPAWLRQLTQAWQDHKSVIITLNYDTLVEQAVRQSTPTGDLYPPYFADITTRRGEAVWGSDNHAFQLRKLHGSVNCHYSGQEDFYGETIFYSDVAEFGHETRTPSIKPLEIAADKTMLLVPPVFDKTPFFKNEAVRALWARAAEALRTAKRVYLIGYSLPASDLGMHSFLIQNCPEESIPFYVINRDAGMPDHYRGILENRCSAKVNDTYVRLNDPVEWFVEDHLQKLL